MSDPAQPSAKAKPKSKANEPINQIHQSINVTSPGGSSVASGSRANSLASQNLGRGGGPSLASQSRARGTGPTTSGANPDLGRNTTAGYSERGGANAAEDDRPNLAELEDDMPGIESSEYDSCEGDAILPLPFPVQRGN